MIHQPLRRPASQNWQQLEINRTLRGELLHQTPEALWFVGRTPEIVREVAAQTAKKLHSLGRHTYLLDRDIAPQHTAELATTLVDAGLIVLVPLPLGSQADRDRIQADTPGRTIHFDLPGTRPTTGDIFEAPPQPALIISKTDSADAIAEQITRELFN
jgi:hypothetical protein